MKYDPVNIFSKWAEVGRDEGMAKAHEPAVLEMLEFIYDTYNSPFSFIDAGCGNGWVVRKILSDSNCKKASGIDGSKKMIEKALLKDPNGNYYCSDLLEWKPNQKVDVVHSMEVLYYFKSPYKLIKHIVGNWINKGGLLIAGIDHYIGNEESYSWSDDLNVHMTLLSSSEWIDIFHKSGLDNCKSWKANQTKDSPGTLVILGQLLS